MMTDEKHDDDGKDEGDEKVEDNCVSDYAIQCNDGVHTISSISSQHYDVFSCPGSSIPDLGH